MMNWIALGAGFVLTLIIGHFLIPELRKLKAGQTIRADGPTWHAGKAGTPAMGGIMFILSTGVLMILLGWKQILNGEFSKIIGLIHTIVSSIVYRCFPTQVANWLLPYKRNTLIGDDIIHFLAYEGTINTLDG